MMPLYTIIHYLLLLWPWSCLY